MARYGKNAQQKVKRAMHERKRGKLKSGRSGKNSQEPQTSDRDRAVGGPARRRQSSAAQIEKEMTLVDKPAKLSGADFDRRPDPGDDQRLQGR
jgi:Family of unknown function (DUF6496)